MRAHYRTANGRLVIEVEGATQKELFKAIAEAQEVFEADTECGCCHSTDIGFRVREVEENQFYELVCHSCQAKLSFGQHRQGGTLFPRRHDEARAPLPNGGWTKYAPR